VRILHLSWNSPPAVGGIEAVVKFVHEGFIAAGDETTLVTTFASEERLAGSSAGWVLDESTVRRAPRPGLKAYAWFALREGWRLMKAGRGRGAMPEVIFCGSIPSAPAAWVLSRRFGVPFVVLMHGTDIMKEGWLYQRIVRFFIKRATVLCSNSENTARILREAGVRGERIRVVYPGVDTTPFTGANPAPPEDATWIEPGRERKVMVSVGRLIKRKGVLEFVDQVMPDVVRRMPDALLWVIGEDATKSLGHHERLKDKIAERVAHHGLGDHVKLLGSVSDQALHASLYAADVFLLPGLHIPNDVEGFGIVFLEAALAGTPAIATRAGGMPEAVGQGEAGLLVEAADPEAMIDAVVLMFEEPGLRDRLAEQAERRAREEFAWPVVVERYRSVLADVVRSR